jgi:endo-1,4-beta-xylanase
MHTYDRLPILGAALALLGIVSAACAGSSATLEQNAAQSAQTAVAGPALRAAAGSRLFGTAVGLRELDSDAAYRAMLGREFSAVTPENAMKWESVEPQQGVYDWSGADAIVAFAQANGQKVHGHTLVWHNQLPSWLSGGTFSAAELSTILQDHITLEAGRYKGKIAAWDVVNEPFDDSGALRDSIWLKGLGSGYIADAFRWAHQADPSAKLYVNDYDIEGINAKSNAIYDLVKSLKAQGVPIDGVGIQGHLDLQYGFPSDLADNIRRFADLGVEVAITELDVRMTLPATSESLAKQADYYGRVVQACTEVSACVGVTVWGFTDKYSWVPFSFAGKGAACLFDENLAPKPAVRTVLDALAAAAK